MRSLAQGNELSSLRKRLSSAKPDGSAGSSDLVKEALGLLIAPAEHDATAEVLALLLSLLRFLKSTYSMASSRVQPTTELDEILPQVTTALQPNGALVDLLLSNLNSPNKTCQNRAADALEAAAQLATVASPLSPSTSSSPNFLVPLLRQLAHSDLSFKPTIRALNILVGSVPRDNFSADLFHHLLDSLLRDFDVTDSASIRCGLIVKLLLYRSALVHTDIENADNGAIACRDLVTHLFPLFDQSTTSTNLYRYLLPILLKARPLVIRSLLEALTAGPQSDSHFQSWVAVASLAVSADVLDSSDLVESEIHSAMQHQDFEIRLQAFTLLVNSHHLLDPKAMDMIKASMHCNRVLTSTGARSDFRSAFYTFLSRLKTAEATAKRTTKKPEPVSRGKQANGAASDLTPMVHSATDFHLWFLQDFVDTGLSHARHPPIAQAMTALSLLSVYLESYRDEEETSNKIFTLERIEALLACQASDFLDIRTRARNILASTPPAISSRLLLDPQRGFLLSATESAKHPRRTQAEAGKSMLCIIFETIIVRSANGIEAVTFVRDLIDQLELHVRASEEDLATAVEQYPLHGLIASLRDVIDCLRLTSHAAQDVWRPTLHRSAAMVSRIWNITRRIISLAPASQTGGMERTQGAGHEISMAYDVLEAAGCVDADDGENAEDLDHTNIVSGCWRATKDAADLLATMTSLPIRQDPESQTIWTHSEIEQVVQQFMEWFQAIRHRATFTKIAVAFGRLIDVIKKNSRYSPLCLTCLQHELRIITQDSVSTTRRSAALPYSILAIVADDQDLFDVAIKDLVGLAEINSGHSDDTRVHAFNILTIVLLDAKHTNHLDQYFEKAVMTAVNALESPNWNVRNVALLFFSTLVNRSLAPPRGGQDYFQSRSIWSTRQTLHSWQNRYPEIIPFILDYLHRLAAKPMIKDSAAVAPNQHSPLFPVLIICRSLKWSEQGQDLANELCAAVHPFLSSPEWQVREVIAQAISSLLSPAQALRRILELDATVLQHCRDLNQTHGQLLLLRLSIKYTVDWDQASAETHRAIGDLLLLLLRIFASQITQPLIRRMVVQNILALIENVPSISRTCVASIPDLWKLLRNPQSRMPGGDLLQQSCAELLVALDDSSPILLQLLSSSHDCKVLALERLSQTGKIVGDDVSERLRQLATLTTGGDQIRTAALSTITELSHKSCLTLSSSDNTKKKSIAASLKDMLNAQKSVPLKEAALPVLGLMISQNPSLNSDDQTVLAINLLQSSEENESQPARYSAMLCLAQLKRQIFTVSGSHRQREALLPLHQVLHRLLEDDDQDIRDKTVGILVDGLQLPRPVVQIKAIELWWGWLGKFLSNHKYGTAWLEWIWDLCIDMSGFDHDISVLKTSGFTTSGVLFEVEPPNLFRNPLVDVAHASRLLVALPESDQGASQLEKKHAQATQVLSRLGPLTPIEEAFEARRRLEERMSLQKPVLDRTKERWSG